MQHKKNCLKHSVFCSFYSQNVQHIWNKWTSPFWWYLTIKTPNMISSKFALSISLWLIFHLHAFWYALRRNGARDPENCDVIISVTRAWRQTSYRRRTRAVCRRIVPWVAPLASAFRCCSATDDAATAECRHRRTCRTAHVRTWSDDSASTKHGMQLRNSRTMKGGNLITR